MIVRITQIDGSFPNIALMKLSHFHKSKGDQVIFEKSIVKGIFEPDYDVVYGSSIFSTSYKKIEQFISNFPNAIIGGTGTNNNETVESILNIQEYEFYDYEIYPEFDASIGFSQRGCRLRCKFCVVPKKEGKNVDSNSIYNIWKQNHKNKGKKIHLLDNDFFGQPNWKEKAKEIIDGEYKVCFNQGINIRLIDDDSAHYLAKMKFRDDSFKAKRIYTAWDNKRDEQIFLKGINCILNAGIKPNEVMVYFLCNYWESGLTKDVWERFNIMKYIGLLPYPMIYEKWNASNELKAFQRWVIRGIYRVTSFHDYMNRSINEYYINKNKINQLKLFDL